MITAQFRKCCLRGRNEVQGWHRGYLLAELWVGFGEEVILNLQLERRVGACPVRGSIPGLEEEHMKD